MPNSLNTVRPLHLGNRAWEKLTHPKSSSQSYIRKHGHKRWMFWLATAANKFRENSSVSVLYLDINTSFVNTCRNSL
ncbi:hypothetical protein TNIN_379661 [Trichonephila inaurata madagascariensis]|uniref:Uncharacterized protein n=1 Tax=Trichonephila inaurata madagascariensis TaxID=2747483 RepID=A0A8X7CNK4_9ARAC|nr:hypothetical protein TNIN_379661 [Trichonephila inaurata madagascariensis]